MNIEIFKFMSTISRKDFAISLVSYSVVIVTLHYIFLYIFKAFDISGTNYFLIKSILGALYLGIFMPFIVARLKDIGISSWWSLIFWLSTIFEMRNILLVNELLGYQLNPFSMLIIIIDIGSLALLVILLSKKSRHNNQLNQDAPKNGAPVS